MQFSGGWKKRWEIEGEDWIEAEKPVKVYSSAERRFLTRVLIQMGGEVRGSNHILDFNLRDRSS